MVSCTRIFLFAASGRSWGFLFRLEEVELEVSDVLVAGPSHELDTRVSAARGARRLPAAGSGDECDITCRAIIV
jgi:hypothetical protein